MMDFIPIKRLFGASNNDGLTDDAILAHQAITANIPSVLYHYYQELGASPFNHIQDNLLAPDELYYDQTGDYLIFYVENQHACVWAIAKDDLTLDNPPVSISFDGQTWQQETERLSDFLLAMANLQAVFGLPFNNEEFYAISLDEKSYIEQHFTKRPVQMTHWIGISFYGNHDNDVIAIMDNDGYYDLAYASGDETQFKELDDILGGLDE